MSDAIRDAALWYAEQKFPVIPVTQDKRPCESWAHFQERWKTSGQTFADVEHLFSQKRWGLALLLWPYSELCCLDFDGPHGLDVWKDRGIILPRSTLHYSPNGVHSIFRVPENCDGLKRTVRLLQEHTPCGWRGSGCGTDLLVNGFLIVPPSPGYAEEPTQPFGGFAELPQEVVALANTNERGDASNGEGEIREGQRNAILMSIAGTLRRRGMSEEEIRVAIGAVNLRRCKPPLPDAEIFEIAKSVCRYDPPTETHHHTDMGNAARFADHHRGSALYVAHWRRWTIWGPPWKIDDAGMILARAKETVRGIYEEAARAPDRETAGRIAQWAFKSESEARLRAMLSLAQSEDGMQARPELFDADPWLLGCRNGVLDLKTGAVLPHHREHFITKTVTLNYDPEVTAPLWLQFLDRIFEGNERLIAYVRRVVGYALTGSTREQCFFLLWGDGDNGKTTLLETLLALTADYGLSTPASTLTQKRGGEIPNDIARLRGARLVTLRETEEGRRLAEGVVKLLTGSDTVSARFLHQEFFDFVPVCKFFLATNHLPRITGVDWAIWKRVKLIPCRVQIPRAEQDKDLGEKLKGELPGILAWAVRGCLEWQDTGLDEPEDVTRATEEYRREQDTLGGFLDEQCILEPGAFTTTKDLYGRYQEWCKEAAEKPVTKVEFGHLLGRRPGLKDDRKGKERTRGWFGIRLT